MWNVYVITRLAQSGFHIHIHWSAPRASPCPVVTRRMEIPRAVRWPALPDSFPVPWALFLLLFLFYEENIFLLRLFLSTTTMVSLWAIFKFEKIQLKPVDASRLSNISSE